jgi:hypothetical protein
MPILAIPWVIDGTGAKARGRAGAGDRTFVVEALLDPAGPHLTVERELFVAEPLYLASVGDVLPLLAQSRSPDGRYHPVDAALTEVGKNLWVYPAMFVTAVGVSAYLGVAARRPGSEWQIAAKTGAKAGVVAAGKAAFTSMAIDGGIGVAKETGVSAVASAESRGWIGQRRADSLKEGIPKAIDIGKGVYAAYKLQQALDPLFTYKTALGKDYVDATARAVRADEKLPKLMSRLAKQEQEVNQALNQHYGQYTRADSALIKRLYRLQDAQARLQADLGANAGISARMKVNFPNIYQAKIDVSKWLTDNTAQVADGVAGAVDDLEDAASPSYEHGLPGAVVDCVFGDKMTGISVSQAADIERRQRAATSPSPFWP